MEIEKKIDREMYHFVGGDVRDLVRVANDFLATIESYSNSGNYSDLSNFYKSANEFKDVADNINNKLEHPISKIQDYEREFKEL